MSANPAAEPVEATPKVPARPKPTPMTFVVHSTPRYGNDILFFHTMDELAVRYYVARVVAEDGSSVAHLARHWCKRNKVNFTLVLRDETLAEVNDRPRRHAVMLAQKPHCALIMNQFDRWQEFAKTMHAAGVPVNFCHPADENNRPKFIPWEPGFAPPPTPSLKWVTAPVRKARRALRATAEHKAETKRRCTAAHDEKRRLIKIMKRMQDGTLGTWRHRRRVGRYALKPPGHRSSMMS